MKSVPVNTIAIQMNSMQNALLINPKTNEQIKIQWDKCTDEMLMQKADILSIKWPH